MKLFCFLLLSSMAFGQGIVVPTQQALGVINGITSPVANATITVCAANASGIPCTPVLASALFKDAALTQPLTNPFTATATGNYVFAIASGNYTVTVTGAGFAGYSYQMTAPLAAGANNTFTGTTTFSGPANFTGGGSLVGIFSGPTTFTGNNTFSGANTGSFINLNNVVKCDQQAGATADVKIKNCFTALPSGGTADATGIVGAQTWAAEVSNCPSNTTLILAPSNAVTFTFTGPQGNFNFALGCSNVTNFRVTGGKFQLNGPASDNNHPLGAIFFNGTSPGSTNIEIDHIAISGDSTLPGNTNFVITSIQRATNVLTVSYTGTPSPALVVGQMVSIIGVTSDVTMNVELQLASVSAGTFTMSNTGANAGPFAQGTFRTEPKFAISSIQRTSNVVTVTCVLAATCNALTVGQNVMIECGFFCGAIDTTYLNTQIVTGSGSGTFTFASTGANSGPFSSIGVFATENSQYAINVQQNITNAHIHDNVIQNVTNGIGCGTSGTDGIFGCEVNSNRLFNIVGYSPGYGYAIVGQTSSLGNYRIHDNFVECAQRHSIYTGSGAGHIISSNIIHRHGCDAPSGGESIPIGRQSDAVVANNLFNFSYGPTIIAFAGATPGSGGQQFMRNIVIANNTMNNTYGFNWGQNAPINEIITSAENSANDVPQGVVINGNISRRTNVGGANGSSAMLYDNVGIGVTWSNNYCNYSSFGSQGIGCANVQGTGETSGTANFNDRVKIVGNQFITTGSSQDVPLYIAATANTSGMAISIENNVIKSQSTTGVFFPGSMTDGNIVVSNTNLGNASGFVPKHTNIYPVSNAAQGTLNVINPLIQTTAPTIAAAGCGGAAASIVVANGTASFKINVGTTPTSACTVTMPAATTGWNCKAEDITTQTTNVFVQKQTGAESTTSVTITNFSDVAVATAFVASDILKVACSAD